jgi:hypothetical protein
VTVAQSQTETVRVTPGQNTAEVTLHLVPFRSDTDGGVDTGVDTGPAKDSGPDTTSVPDAGADVAPDAPAPDVTPDRAPDLPAVDTGSDTPPATDGGGDRPPADAGADTLPVVRSWGGPALAENNIDENDTDPVVVVDGTDRATIAYQHGSGIWANHVDTRTDTRGTEGAIPNAVGNQTVNASIGVDGNGVTTVMWEGTIGDATNQGIWSSTSTTTGWTPPYHVSSGRAFSVSVAVSANGVAIAAWTENNLVGGLNQFIVWTSYRPAGGQWAAAKSIMTASDSNDRNAHVTLDATGKGFLIWEQPLDASSANVDVWVSRFSGSSFDTPMRIETFDAGDAVSPNIAANAAGGAAAVWLQLPTSSRDLWGRVYAGGAWGAPIQIASASYIARTDPPGVAIDAAGNAIAAYAQSTATGPYNVRVARYRAGQPAWEMPMPLESNNNSQGSESDLPSPRVGYDGAGNALVLWRKTSGAGLTNLFSVPVSSAGALGTLARIDNDNVNGVFGHQLAVAQDGTAIAVWFHASQFNIMANVYR